MSTPAEHHGRLRRLLAIMTTAVVLTAFPAGTTASDPQVADAGRREAIVEKLRAAEHVHPDGSTHQHDGMASLTPDELRFLGIRRGSGECSGLYELADDSLGDSCTHGLDVSIPAEAGAEAGAEAAADCGYPNCGFPEPAGWSVPTHIPCYSTGPYVEVLYLYWGTSRLPTYLEKIRRSVASIDQLFRVSAAAVKSSGGTPGNRHVRWAMASGCKLKVTSVKLPTNLSSGIQAIKGNLVSRGVIKSSAKYLGYVDLGACSGGVAELPQSSIPGATNPSNNGGTLGLTYGDCFEDFHPYAGFGATIAAHELMHTLGGVQGNAPHTTGGHCWDDSANAHLGADVMCYYDGGVPSSKFYQRCPQTYPETFDCGNDDYYNPYPTTGSYLQRYWNPARNRFLSTVEPTAWDPIAGPKVTFTKPSVSGGTVGGDAPAVVQVSGGLPIGSVAWTLNGASVAGETDTLELETARTRTSGYANGVQLSLGATVTDEGLLIGKATTKAIVANPWIRLTAPTEWADTSGPTSWSATGLAYGGKTVAKVDLLVDGVVRATDTTSPFGGTFNPAGLGSAGSMAYEVAARVTDSAGITRTTLTRLVNRPAPTIVWRAPASEWDGWSQEFPYPALAGSTVKVQVDATTTAPGGISRVLFRVDGTTTVTDYSAPYTFDYVVPASGVAAITARAVDQRGIYDTTPNGIWVGAMAAPGSIAFSAPTGSESDPVSGPTPFSVAISAPGGTLYDTACLYIDLVATDCVDATSGIPVTVDVSSLRPGWHVAHWQIQGWTGSEFLDVRGPFRRFVVAGTGPTIAITQLTSGLRVSGSRVVGAIVSGLPSGVQVNAVSFLENGYPLGTDYAAAYYLSWNTRTFGDGPRTVRALAELSDGSTLSATVDVVVVNASARLTAPLAGEHVLGIEAIAGSGSYDSETAMESAVFYVDGAIIGTDRFAPFSVNWDTSTATNGSHNLTMRLTFTDGRSITTAPTTVNKP